MKVYFPSRILDRETGGNTTYTRNIADGLRQLGTEIGRIPSGPHPAITIGLESAFGLPKYRDSILHYSADTGPLVRPRNPTVITIHGVASRWTRAARTPYQERVWRTRVAAAARFADRIVTVSNSSARDISHVFGVTPERIATIPHGISPVYAEKVVETPPRIRQWQDQEYLLFLGNLEPRKNLPALLQAYKLLRRSSVVPPLLIAGKPAWNASSSTSAMANAEGVYSLGFVSEVEKRWLYQNCTLFIFPSLYEGFGFPVLEAQAAGARVLSSENGSLVEVLGPADRLHSLSPPDIASAIEQAMAVDDTDAERAERVRWAAKFSWSTSVRAHQALYEEVLG